MQLGMIGLGRMGANIVRRLMSKGHHCVVFDTNAKVREALAKEGATGAGFSYRSREGAQRKAACRLGYVASRSNHRRNGRASWRIA